MHFLPSGTCKAKALFGFKIMDLILRFRPNDHIIYREEEDGAFLFDPETGNLKYMNGAAKNIYLMLNGENNTDSVIHNLRELYPDAKTEQIQEDVEIFMQQLEENDFISASAG